MTPPPDLADADPPPVPGPARTTAYGSDPAQVYDVRLPIGQQAGDATVVIVHGGFWKAEWDRAHAATQAQAFADAGYHVAVVEYRRTGMPGGGWPGTFADVAAAVAAVRADPTLPDRCVLLGHSAGGHLVALAAGQPWAEGLAGVVSLAGCVDLDLVAALDLGAGAASAFLGSAPAGTAASGSWADAEPSLHPPRVPVVLVHGDADDTVPLAVSQRYLDRSTSSGRPHATVRLHGIPGAGHDAVIEPGQPAFDTTLAAVGSLVPD